MTKKELEKLIAKYQKRADDAAEKFQETGLRRYYTTHWNNLDLADALRMAASAKHDHEMLSDMRMMLSNFASRGAAATSPLRSSDERAKLALTLAKEIAEYGQRNGLI